jgi:hypothetical protein
MTHLKSSQHAWDKFVNFEQTNILSDARPAAHSKLEHRPIHLLYATILSLLTILGLGNFCVR